MLSTLPLIYWKGVNMRGGMDLLSPPIHSHRAAAELKAFTIVAADSPGLPVGLDSILGLQ